MHKPKKFISVCTSPLTVKNLCVTLQENDDTISTGIRIRREIVGSVHPYLLPLKDPTK